MADAPKDPDRFDRDRHVARDNRGMSGASIAAVSIACALLVTIVFYAVNRGDEPVTSVSAPPAATSSSPATTGQSQETPESASANPAAQPKAKSEEKAKQ